MAYHAVLRGGINPASADFLLSSLREAQSRRAAALVIEMDTPGGLLDSTREITQAFLVAEVPILLYVSPPGARAGSAGVFIAMASHVAAMAPGTNIGAAHPVGAAGGDIEGHMGKKVENDAAANVRSIAAQRGRNADWAESAVRDSDAITAEKALEIGAVEILAKDVPDLLRQSSGRTVTLGKDRKVTLELAQARIEKIEMSGKQRLLARLSDPSLVFILMLLGFLGIFIEAKSPGLVIPGVLGGLCLLVAFGVQTLPINWLGVVFIIAAFGLFVAEVYVTSFGLLAVGGLTCLVIGAYILFSVEGSEYRVPLPLIFGVSLGVASVFLTAAWLIARVLRQRPLSGAEGLVGEEAEVRAPIGPSGRPGKVFVQSAYWDAESDTPIGEIGTRVRVESVRGMVLKVRRV